MDDILNDFVAEATESVSQLDIIMLELENNPQNSDKIQEAFRVLHTLKGTSGFLGLNRLQTISHAAENLLGRMRDGAIEAQGEVINTLLITNDRLKMILTNIEKTGGEGDSDDQPILKTLHDLANPPQASEVSEKTKVDMPSVPVIGGENLADKNDAKAEVSPKPLPAIRIHVESLDNMVNLVTELVLVRNQLLSFSKSEVTPESNQVQQNCFNSINHLTSHLQEQIMKMRLQPISQAWTQVPRMVRDLCNTLGKKIELTQIGEETELDRQIIEMIKDPLVHMIRNSADHGVELPDDRVKAGKSPKGLITLKAYQEGNYVFVEVIDDGRGLDPEKLKEKILEKGLATASELSGLSAEDINAYIFAPGFSTASAVTNVSGRGVGMDVVKSNIEKLGGSITIFSTPGYGTRFRIKIPLTLSIISTLIVAHGPNRFAIPQANIVEVMRLKSATTKLRQLNNKPVVEYNNSLIPLYSLKEVLALEDVSEKYLVVIHSDTAIYALQVAEIHAIQEIVIKPLNKATNVHQYFSGATLLGDSSVALILSPSGFAPKSDNNHQIYVSPKIDRPDPKTLLLTFRCNDVLKAVPLALISRIDLLPRDALSKIGQQDVVVYDEKLVPLSYLAHIDDDQDSVSVLILNHHDRMVVLAISEILDVVISEIQVDIQRTDDKTLGSFLLKGQPISIIDCEAYLKETLVNWEDHSVEINSSRGRLLLVEDSNFFRNLMLPVLKIAGYEVVDFGCAKDALTFLEKDQDFDAIISDIFMPDMDGCAFVQELKSRGGFDRVPKIALTALDSDRDKERIYLAGFDSHVIKSDQQSFLHTLSHILKTHNANEALNDQ